MSARIIVTGWRGANDGRDGPTIRLALLEASANIELPPGERPTLVHGACHLGGADLIAANLANGWGWRVEAHPAQGHPTQDFGPWPGAGPRRNRYMCSLGAVLVLAFPGPGSRGTWDCLHWAQRYGIPFRGYPLGIGPL